MKNDQKKQGDKDIQRALSSAGWRLRRSEERDDHHFSECTSDRSDAAAVIDRSAGATLVTIEHRLATGSALPAPSTGANEALTMLGSLAQALPHEVRPRLRIEGQVVTGVLLSMTLPSSSPTGEELADALERLEALRAAVPASWDATARATDQLHEGLGHRMTVSHKKLRQPDLGPGTVLPDLGAAAGPPPPTDSPTDS